jgi:NADP-dependent 3-hydroxy acid dehydrogenase YdfG
MDLTGRRAIVTGASSGIGAGTAKALAAEGVRVALVARRGDRLEEIAEEIDTAETMVTPTDVTDTEAIDAMVEETVDAFGGIDILVNNAGVLKPDPVTDADRTDLRSQIEVNLLGAMNTTHAVLSHLLEGELGDVITVSSMNARHAARGGSAYTASKYGINGFCDSLRKEMSEEAVRVTVILPGPVVTEMRQWDDWEGRPLDPHDVAEAIVFAVSRPPHVELPDIPVNSTDKLG